MKTEKKRIPEDYLCSAEALKPFYSYDPTSPDFRKIIADKSVESVDRSLLVQVIREQYASLELYPETKQALNRLEQDNSYTITTGHQLVFLGGPLYTTYKVIHTIKLAQYLQSLHPDYHFVPVFWIHTEDHDYEEINHYFRAFDQKMTYPGKFEGKVGQHIIGSEITGLLPEHFPPYLKNAYQPDKSWAEAYREYMHALFGPYGILMLDADDHRLKATFQEIFNQEITSQVSYHQVSDTTQALEEAGYTAQITPREINLFYAEGQLRNRIISRNGHYEVLDSNISFTQEAILSTIEQWPGYFSPNVSLRPLYQEVILPNLAYIGGWGELSYWLQLKGLFEHYKVNFPLLLPRMSATLFRPLEAQAWNELGFDISDISLSQDQLNKRLVSRFWQPDTLDQLQQNIIAGFEELENYIHTISPTLPRSVKGQEIKTRNFFHNLEKKIHRVIKNSHGEFFQLAELKQQIQPDGMKQERILSLAAFPECDPGDLIDQIWERCDPLSLKPVFLTLTF